MSEEETDSKESRDENHLEIKPFDGESQAEFNHSVTFKHIEDGSQLPIKLEIFPKQLLGLPIYDLSPRKNEKVTSPDIIFRKYY